MGKAPHLGEDEVSQFVSGRWPTAGHGCCQVQTVYSLALAHTHVTLLIIMYSQKTIQWKWIQCK